MKNMLSVLVCILFFLHAQAQTWYQHFDGADTLEWNSLFIEIDQADSNLWQIGPPQKTHFNSAFTPTNVIVTDTLLPYPANDSASFSFLVANDYYSYGIMALEWMQKIDSRAGLDGGIIEYSFDQGVTWENVINNPYTYNFYGFDEALIDTLPNGQLGFTGTDTTWSNVWLCFDYSWLYYYDFPKFRFSFVSTENTEPTPGNQDGWMIDNLISHITIIHTVSEAEKEEYMRIYPNPTTGIVNIDTRKIDAHHIIETIFIKDGNGRIVKEYGISPTKFSLDLSDLPNGLYVMEVNTNIQTETFKVLLEK